MSGAEQLAGGSPVDALAGGRAAARSATAEIDGIIDPEVLWDCTTCGACVEQCPVDIEHVDHIVDMRRYQVMIESEFPTELGGLFRNLENKGNPWGQNQKDRMAWAKDLAFEVPVITDELDPDHRVPVLGGLRRGVRRPGEEDHPGGRGADAHAPASGSRCSARGRPAPVTRPGGRATSSCSRCCAQATWRPSTTRSGPRAGTRKIVVTCPHCFNTLSNEYGDLGGHYEVIHHTQLLNRLVRDGGWWSKKPDRTEDVTYHDPCYLGRHNKVYIAAAGADRRRPGCTLKEMPRQQRPVVVLRRRRGADVDGGEDRQADQPGTHRRGPRHRRGDRSPPAARSARSCSPTASPQRQNEDRGETSRSSMSAQLLLAAVKRGDPAPDEKVDQLGDGAPGVDTTPCRAPRSTAPARPPPSPRTRKATSRWAAAARAGRRRRAPTRTRRRRRASTRAAADVEPGGAGRRVVGCARGRHRGVEQGPAAGDRPGGRLCRPTVPR